MPRKTTAWAATCAAALLALSGCRFFGIDTRPDIRYVTEGQRKNVDEPMFSMPVAGTGLFKQWPMRLGAEYGYAPWEKKPSGASPADGEVAARKTAAANATSHPSATTGQAAGGNAIAANAAVATKAAKPSHRATPRLADGEVADELIVTAGDSDDAIDASRVATNRAHVVADDFDLPAAARGTLDFRSPSTPSASASTTSAIAPLGGEPSRVAAAVVSRAGVAAATTRPPREEFLPWRPTGDELSDEADDRTAGGATAAATDSVSSIGLQQPGVFSARKAVAVAAPRSQPYSQPRAVTTSSRNMLRDEAVQPAAAVMPIEQPRAAPLGAPARLPAELIPPNDDSLNDDSMEDNISGNSAGGVSRELPRDMPFRPSHRAAANWSNERAMHSYSVTGERSMAARNAQPTVVGPTANYTSNYDYDAGSEPVFVTASDMGDEGVAVAREYSNRYAQASGTSAYGSTASRPSMSGKGEGQKTFRESNAGVLSELEAAKRNILP
ncbi:MAG: hypothetical protein WD875_03285 [Pirellulales bacterium]